MESVGCLLGLTMLSSSTLNIRTFTGIAVKLNGPNYVLWYLSVDMVASMDVVGMVDMVNGSHARFVVVWVTLLIIVGTSMINQPMLQTMPHQILHRTLQILLL